MNIYNILGWNLPWYSSTFWNLSSFVRSPAIVPSLMRTNLKQTCLLFRRRHSIQLWALTGTRFLALPSAVPFLHQRNQHSLLLLHIHRGKSTTSKSTQHYLVTITLLPYQQCHRIPTLNPQSPTFRVQLPIKLNHPNVQFTIKLSQLYQVFLVVDPVVRVKLNSRKKKLKENRLQKI